MTLAMAQKAVQAALEKAKELGAAITVSVVDQSGRLVMCARGDGTGFFTPETSRAKAVAAAAFKRSTKEMVQNRDSAPAFWGNVAAVTGGEALPSTGAVPIVVNGSLVGAIGCGGGSAEQDHLCAEAGASAVA
jgi:glc operon protein GlcG